jgi:hypothetical protein
MNSYDTPSRVRARENRFNVLPNVHTTHDWLRIWVVWVRQFESNPPILLPPTPTSGQRGRLDLCFVSFAFAGLTRISAQIACLKRKSFCRSPALPLGEHRGRKEGAARGRAVSAASAQVRRQDHTAHCAAQRHHLDKQVGLLAS